MRPRRYVSSQLHTNPEWLRCEEQATHGERQCTQHPVMTTLPLGYSPDAQGGLAPQAQQVDSPGTNHHRPRSREGPWPSPQMQGACLTHSPTEPPSQICTYVCSGTCMYLCVLSLGCVPKHAPGHICTCACPGTHMYLCALWDTHMPMRALGHVCTCARSGTQMYLCMLWDKHVPVRALGHICTRSRIIGCLVNVFMK